MKNKFEMNLYLYLASELVIAELILKTRNVLGVNLIYLAVAILFLGLLLNINFKSNKIKN